MKKKCTKCGEVKDTSLFYKNKQSKDGLYPSCKKCKKKYQKSYVGSGRAKEVAKLHRDNNKVSYKVRELNKVMDITEEQIVKMLEDSDGTCDLCDKKFKGREPYFDHCHETRKPRGLLCHQCNWGLGLLGDNKKSLLKAVTYLS